MNQDTEGTHTGRRPEPADIAAAWDRELPGVPTSSITVLTPVRRAAKLLDDDRRRTLARLGTDAATLDLLSTLRRSGDPWTLTTRDLATQCLVSAGAISQRVARAEAAGLVARAPSDAGPRAVDVRLTAAGHTRVEQVVRELLEHEESLLAALPDEVRAALASGLDALTGHLVAAADGGVSAAGAPRSSG